MYPHEAAERLPNPHPYNTVWPDRAVNNKRMQRYLTDRNLNWTLAIDNGWYESGHAGDAFRRIVIPAVTYKEGHIYWQARDITQCAFLRYQSPKGPRHEALIRVLPAAELRQSRGNVIVEGPLDALAAADCGYTGFALMGMQPSDGTLCHLGVRLDRKPCVVVLDRDCKQHGIRVVTFLASHAFTVQLGSLPGPEKDLAECPPTKRQLILDHLFRNLFR